MVEQTDHPDMNALSLVDRLFVLLVVNPEIDIHMIEEILSSKSYYNKTITKWKKAGMIKGEKKEGLATYRLTNLGKKMVQERFPGVVGRYLTDKNGSYKIFSRKIENRRRYAEDAWIYQSMLVAGVDCLGEGLFLEDNGVSPEYTGNPPRMTYFGKPDFKAHLNQEQLGSRNKGAVFDVNGKPYLVYGTYAGHITFYRYKEFALSRVALGKFESAQIVPQGTMKLPVIVFGHEYDHAETIWENTNEDTDRFQRGQTTENAKLRLTDDFERVICIPRGRTGRTSTRLLLDPETYTELKAQLLTKMEPSGNRVIDAYSKSGQSVYVMFVMDMNKLAFIMSEDNEAVVVCFKGLQEEFLRKVTGNRRRKISFYPIDEETIVNALGLE